MKTEAETDLRAFVTLRFAGDDLDPGEISAVLRAAPTRAHRKGEEFFAGSYAGKLRGRTGMWFLATDRLVQSDHLDDHFAFVQRRLCPEAGEDRGISKLRDILERTHCHAHITYFWHGDSGEAAREIPDWFKSAMEPLCADIEANIYPSPLGDENCVRT